MLNPAPADKNQQIIPCEQSTATRCVADYFDKALIPVVLKIQNHLTPLAKTAQTNVVVQNADADAKTKATVNVKVNAVALTMISMVVNKVAKGTYGTYAVETAGNHCARGLDASNLGAAGYNSPSPVGATAGFAASEQATFYENSLTLMK